MTTWLTGTAHSPMKERREVTAGPGELTFSEWNLTGRCSVPSPAEVATICEGVLTTSRRARAG